MLEDGLSHTTGTGKAIYSQDKDSFSSEAPAQTVTSLQKFLTTPEAGFGEIIQNDIQEIQAQIPPLEVMNISISSSDQYSGSLAVKAAKNQALIQQKQRRQPSSTEDMFQWYADHHYGGQQNAVAYAFSRGGSTLASDYYRVQQTHTLGNPTANRIAAGIFNFFTGWDQIQSGWNTMTDPSTSTLERVRGGFQVGFNVAVDLVPVGKLVKVFRPIESGLRALGLSRDAGIPEKVVSEGTGNPVIDNMKNRVPNDEIFPPPARGNAPISKKDGRPIEIHHEGRVQMGHSVKCMRLITGMVTIIRLTILTTTNLLKLTERPLENKSASIGEINGTVVDMISNGGW